MELTLATRLRNAWNAFSSKNPLLNNTSYMGYSSYYRPDRTRLSRGNEKSIINSVYNRIALDVAGLEYYHCKMDENDRFKEPMKSSLNDCLTLEANIDQTSTSLFIDIVISMFDEGSVAIVPVDTKGDPTLSESYDILTMRTGRVVSWMPQDVTIELYNERSGRKEQITLPKKMVCIIENPFYSVMNEPNSILQRLIRKLNLLDSIDEQSGSGKLDLIIQLPYIVKSEARKLQAEQRRKDIERQLSGSKYGIAYTDGTEKITQLNRPIENNLMKQIEYLTSMLYSQLGITQAILDGTADEKTMVNYYSRTVEPIASSIVDEMKRKFLSKTARTQHQSIIFFRDPFKLVPTDQLAEISDKFTRNEILTSNEVRQSIGRKPSNDPKADELRNSNLNHPDENGSDNENIEIDEEIQNGNSE